MANSRMTKLQWKVRHASPVACWCGQWVDGLGETCSDCKRLAAELAAREDQPWEERR